MGLRQIAIRDETVEALEALLKKANKSRDEVGAGYSDVIDVLLFTKDELVTSDRAFMELVVARAAEN